jgi:hypothetical protein
MSVFLLGTNTAYLSTINTITEECKAREEGEGKGGE